MRIAVQMVIEVDAEAWAEEYGIEKADVRQDVKNYVLNGIQTAAGIEATDATVTLR